MKRAIILFWKGLTGIVLTYHPYQIDCFAAGEYHAVIPFKEANKCLMFDYSKHEDLKPKLQRFIK